MSHLRTGPILLLLGLSLSLAPPPALARDARETVRAAWEHWRGASSRGEMTMTIHRPDWERSMSMKVWSRGQDESLVRVTEPRKDAGHATLIKDDEMWTYSPKVNRVLKVPSSMMGQSWMGSDFSNKDVSRADTIVDQYEHTLLETETRDGHEVYVIESVPHEDAAVVWGKEVLRVRDDNVLLREDFYDQDGKRVKSMRALEIGERGGRTLATRLRMENEEAQGEWTELVTESMRFDLDLPDRLFTLSNLRNPLASDVLGLSLRLAWRNLWRHPRRTWLTTGAMIFSNVILVFLISMQLGMYQLMIDNSLRATTGHLQVQARGYHEEQKIRQTVPEVEDLAQQMRDALGLEKVAPRAAAFALVSSEERSYGIRIVGVVPERERLVSSLPGLVAEGRYLEGTDTTEIVVGRILARNLKAGVGDELTFLGSARDGSFAAAVATIVGLLDSGNADLDRSLAQVPLDFFQETFAMGSAGHRVVILAPDLFQVSRLERRAKAALPPNEDLVVLDWQSLVPGLKQAIQADLSSAIFMYAVLVVLVGFSVLNTQLMSVLERTREFGIVLALGVSPGRLTRLVLLETTVMALMGLVIGVALGGAVVLWFGVHGFSFPGLDQMAGQFNLPDRIHLELSATGLLVGPSVVFLASLLATLYPMTRLLRMDPVEAMGAA